jgi:SulP family sulfate permease
VLQQIESMLADRDGYLVFSHFAVHVPSGKDFEEYFNQIGLVKAERCVRVFDTRDEALQWIEDRLLVEAGLERATEQPLELREMGLFAGRKEETLAALEACMEKRSFAAGARIFARNDVGETLFLVRRGAVRVELPVAGKFSYHAATFGRGDFFGEMSFLDHEPRSADAIAFSDVEVYELSRERFDALAGDHRKLAIQLLEGLARALAIRLRRVNRELRALQEG